MLNMIYLFFEKVSWYFKIKMIINNYLYLFSWFVFFFFFFFLNLKIKRATQPLFHSGIKNPFLKVALHTRESLKRPYFPLPLSILAGTNLIMLLLLFSFFCNLRLIPRITIQHVLTTVIAPVLIVPSISLLLITVQIRRYSSNHGPARHRNVVILGGHVAHRSQEPLVGRRRGHRRRWRRIRIRLQVEEAPIGVLTLLQQNCVVEPRRAGAAASSSSQMLVTRRF